MDLTKLKEAYPKFLLLLKDRGYKATTIEKYQWVINRLLSEAQVSDIRSFEDYFFLLKGRLSAKSLPEVKTYLGALKHYVESGVFHRDHSYRSGFMEESSYTQLNEYYRILVDHFLQMCETRKRYACSTVRSIKSAGSVFCLYFQQHGCKSFDSIKSQKPILEYFHDGEKPLRSSAHRYYVFAFLSICGELDSSCKCILSFLPNVPEYRKNYDYLKPDEKVKIEGVLSNGSLSLRDKAVGITAYYTGLRSSDIANLCLDDVDLDKNVIIIDQQKKTGEPLTLPLRPVVRDAICEYVEKGRPVVNDERIFITEQPLHKRMQSGSMYNAAKKILDSAGVRTKGGRKGLHLFRHAFTSDLISKDVPRWTVSALLGHSSYSSLNSYIDADIEHLRSCALSISEFRDGSIGKAVISQYACKSSELLHQLTEELRLSEQLDPYMHQTICSLDEYCSSHHPDTLLTQQILDAWSFPHADETHKRYARRMQCAEKINSILLNKGLEIIAKEYPAIKARNSFYVDFISSCKELFDDYIMFQKASQHWNTSYQYALKSFDVYCHGHIPGSKLPDQETIDLWSRCKDSERLTSCGKRVAFFTGLCGYTNRIHGTRLKSPEIPTNDGHHPSPYAFNEVDLKNFFISCDNIDRLHKSQMTLQRAVIVPAIFRLTYSTGMRTKEVRMLDCEDIDLIHGVIDIRRSKGLNEHRVALHPSVWEYLKEYDRTMCAVMPGRICFFPNVDDRYYSTSWLEWDFELMWYKFNGGYAIPYDFRHNYAIANINIWPADSDAFNRNLVYLSRSMGHASLDSTMYYYSYTPKMAQSIMECKSDSFNDVVSGFHKSDISSYED